MAAAGGVERVLSALAEKNKTREVPILAPRGKILDRDGRVIVDNYPSFTALLLRDSTRDLTGDADLIAQGLHLDPKEVRERLRKFAGTPQYQPIYLKEDITPDELAFIESHRNELPELDTITAHRRLYPRNGFMAHLVGYVGEVSEQMLNQAQLGALQPGRRGGQVGSGAGIQPDPDGQERFPPGAGEQPRQGSRATGREAGSAGKATETDAWISICRLPRNRLWKGGMGPLSRWIPETAKSWLWSAGPTYDPNDFAVRISNDEWMKLVNDVDHPLLNKAIQAQLAPGSVFKIIMATAGLQEGIAQDMKVNCTGGASFYGRYFKCWVVAEHRTHGIIDISKGIYQSCDVFFYTLAESLGIERIAKYAMAMFGMGQKTGIDLPQEVSGVMPSEEWKIRNFKQKWYAGETISVGIGQGAVAATPIQLARAIGAIASGGLLVRPHVTNPQGSAASVDSRVERAGADEDPDRSRELGDITDAMAGVCPRRWDGGAAHLQGIDFAGKTGSAQTISNMLKAKTVNGKPKYKDNGWFVGVDAAKKSGNGGCSLVEGGEHGHWRPESRPR